MNNKKELQDQISVIESDLWFYNILHGFKFILFLLATIAFIISAFNLELISLLAFITGFITFMIFNDIKEENKKTKSRIKYLMKTIQES